MRLLEKVNPDDGLNITDKTIKTKKEYAGNDKRPSGRFEHSPEVEAIIRDIRGVLCSTQNCLFSKEEQQTVKHLNGMYGDIGNKDSSAGIEVHRETTKHVKNVMDYIKDAKKYVWRVVVVAAISWAGYGLWYAFLREINR